MKKVMKILGLAIVFELIAMLIVSLVYNSGIYPAGSDTMCHIYKGDILYQNICNGDFYPLYDSLWYNGVEMLRYWAPLPVYFLAMCQAIAGGNALDGYLIFIGFVFVLGALAWTYIGVKKERIFFGAFLGILWFFLPNNLIAMFYEGNLPRSLCMVMLPLLIYCVYEYMNEGQWKYLFGVIGWFFLIVFCHSGYAGMIMIGILIFLVVYSISQGKYIKGLHIIACLVASFVMTGLWIVPSLTGGITSTDSSEVMALFFQSGFLSLNPLDRLSGTTNFYFGLAMFLLAVFGMLCSKKKMIPGFITGLIIFFATTNTAYPALKILPGSQYLWMLRFISIALCFIFYSFLLWKSLRKSLSIAICVLLVLDAIPSLYLITGSQDGMPAQSRLNAQQEWTLIAKAKSLSRQRIALLDESSLGATGAFLVSDYNGQSKATFGAGWQSANTAPNIAQLNRALTEGDYYYLFDRLQELGNDVVIVQIAQIDERVAPIYQMDEAASKCGYYVADSNQNYRLYHLPVDGTWGTICQYDSIGIGTAANMMALQFPDIEETTSSNLNDYTFEQLSQYKTVYLNGFTYRDKEAAEQLILDLSEAGVRIVILADGIPEDRNTQGQQFLGVHCYPINFSNGYPELDTVDGVLYCDLFPNGFSQWSTVYVQGLDDVWGSIIEEDMKLDFYGTVKNENIIVIGLNLTYHYSLTKDRTVGKLLSHALKMDQVALPKRQIVPYEIQYGKREITISTNQDQLNTGLAFHDIFQSDGFIEGKNHLLYVNQGTTTIRMVYPMFWAGLLVSVFGVFLCVVILVLTRVDRNHIGPSSGEGAEKTE